MISVSSPVLSLEDKSGRAMTGCRGGLKSWGRLMVLMAEDERDGGDLRPGFWVWPSGGCALIGRGVAGARVGGWPPVSLK